jgi:hypothetical protein
MAELGADMSPEMNRIVEDHHPEKPLLLMPPKVSWCGPAAGRWKSDTPWEFGTGRARAHPGQSEEPAGSFAWVTLADKTALTRLSWRRCQGRRGQGLDAATYLTLREPPLSRWCTGVSGLAVRNHPT